MLESTLIEAQRSLVRQLNNDSFERYASLVTPTSDL